ncbi:AAA family ATPase [Bacillus cereus]|uniref:ParA family protein n=1 Tax=Bacillus cereus TaxID=1396 RepID=UPI0019251F4B|nr:AAA family ATPase [Bacillus cereus]MBL3889124.1 AAA family ATPase [Bacillus cereus]
MKIVSFISLKGGVGKTTLVSNLATELAIRGKKVLLIDLDLQANLSMTFFNSEEYMQYSREGKTIAALYSKRLFDKEEKKIKDIIISPQLVNQDIVSNFSVACPIDMVISDLGLINNSNQKFRPNKLKDSLSGIREFYDVVLIDCPPSIGNLNEAAIIASDYYVIPAIPNFLSVMGIDLTMKFVNEMKIEHAIENLEFLGVLFNMVRVYGGEPIKQHIEVMKEVRDKDFPIFSNYIPFYEPNAFVDVYNNGSMFLDTNDIANSILLEKLVDEFIKQLNL